MQARDLRHHLHASRTTWSGSKRSWTTRRRGRGFRRQLINLAGRSCRRSPARSRCLSESSAKRSKSRWTCRSITSSRATRKMLTAMSSLGRSLVFKRQICSSMAAVKEESAMSNSRSSASDNGAQKRQTRRSASYRNTSVMTSLPWSQKLGSCL